MSLSGLLVGCGGDTFKPAGATTSGIVGSGGIGANGGAGGIAGTGAGNGGVGGLAPCDACEGLKPFCNDAKECVACLVSSHCGGNVCKSDGTCSDFGTEQAACDECDTGANCLPNLFCIVMAFPPGGDTVIGSFCQPALTGTCGEATRPYSTQATDMPTADGDTAHVCTLVTTTCQGLKDHATPKGCVASDDECGVVGQADGLCRSDGSPMAPFLCTYPCTADEHCPAGAPCSNTSPSFCVQL